MGGFDRFLSPDSQICQERSLEVSAANVDRIPVKIWRNPLAEYNDRLTAETEQNRDQSNDPFKCL